MQIAGQKSLSRTFPVQESSKLAKPNKILSNRQRFFIFSFPVKQEELYKIQKSGTSKRLIVFRGNSSEDLPSEDYSWTHMENREHQIIAEQHGTQSFELQTM